MLALPVGVPVSGPDGRRLLLAGLALLVLTGASACFLGLVVRHRQDLVAP